MGTNLNTIILQKDTESISNKPLRDVKMWDIYIADLPEDILNDGKKSSIQSGLRPVIIFCNDKCAKYSSVIHVIPFTTQSKKIMPTHMYFNKALASSFNIKEDCTAEMEQIRIIDKSRLRFKIGEINNNKIRSQIIFKHLIQFLGNYDLNYLSDDILNMINDNIMYNC